MAGSSPPGVTGANPSNPSATTRGPLGSNNDAADPDTPQWFKGNTPGPVGHGDHADPAGTMCQMTRQGSVADYLRQGRIARLAECNAVRRELRETYRVRNAFADPALIKQADEKGMDGDEYNNLVGESVFGPPTRGQTTFVAPMFTDPMKCRIVENWDHATYVAKGIPRIIYDADRKHEEVHKKSCDDAGGPDSMEYIARMSFPKNRSADEVKAYNKKIEVLEQWLQDHCMGTAGRAP